MPTPAGYTEWGYLGGLIFTVVAFLTYLWRRDKASAAKDKSMQDFFGQLFRESKAATADLVAVIRELTNEFREHDDKTTEAIATMKERTNRKTIPRNKPPAP
jgi:hypothetical protein